MITQVHARGTLVGAAIRRAYAARDVADPAPQLIAVWDTGTELSDLEAPVRPGGYDTGRLAALLAEPLTAGVNPPTRPVWRCTLELDPAERRLTAREWADAVRELLDETGLAPHGDDDAVRWVAVGHGHRRVDIVATLVRQDGRIEPARGDRHRCLDATRAIERRFRLSTTPTAPDSAQPVRTHPAPATLRTTPPSVRDRLRREVRATAIIAIDENNFLTRLRDAGLGVRVRRRGDGSVSGYAVSEPSASTDTDASIWFGGGRLAPELSLPHLRNRWAQRPRTADSPPPTTPSQRQRIWQQTTDAVSTAATTLTSPAEPLTTDSAHAVADILTMTARAISAANAHPLTDAADLLRRAIGERWPIRRAAPDARAVHLRSLARLIGLMGQLSNDRDVTAALQLVYLVASFAENLATLRQAQQRRAQAAAASTAATHLYTTAPHRPRPPAVPGPLPAATSAPPAHQHTRRRSR